MLFKKARIKGAVAVLLILTLLTTAFCSCRANPDGIDYSDTENWAYYGEGSQREADLFFICPTVDMGRDGNFNMSMDDEKTKGNFVGAINMQRGIYDGSANVYAPYYRQMTFPVYSMTDEEMDPYLQIAYNDVKDAFEYYFENVNEGRPIVLAGFSQGAQLLLMLLEEYFDNSEYADRLVAAYCIGWRITEEQLESYPHLKMAQGEDDTGVIVSFNTEDGEADDSIVVPRGTKTVGINPLNWKTDSTVADRTLNNGACFTNYDGEIEEEIAEMTGAYLDAERGTLKVTDVDPEDYSSSLFPTGIYHLYDYQFFFRNLEENVGVRLRSYLDKQK